MAVRAKFYVQSVTIQSRTPEGRNVGQVTLSAVTRGEVNKDWSHYTPWGEVKLGTMNPDAFEVFERALGREFYLTFEEAPDEEQSVSTRP